jgi:hypothetical protein
MGILESDLVKFGVDVLTKFLEIINKATSAFDGLGGSITKILTVVSLFKLGQKIFEKIKNPLYKFFADLTKMGYQAGYDAGKAYADGTKKARDEEEIDSKVDKARNREKKKTIKDKAKDFTGLTSASKAKDAFTELAGKKVKNAEGKKERQGGLNQKWQ